MAHFHVPKVLKGKNGTDVVRSVAKKSPRSHSQRPIGDQIDSLKMSIRKIEHNIAKAAIKGQMEKLSSLSSLLVNQKERLGILADQYTHTARNRITGRPIISPGIEPRPVHSTDKTNSPVPSMSGPKARGYWRPPLAKERDKGRTLVGDERAKVRTRYEAAEPSNPKADNDS